MIRFLLSTHRLTHEPWSCPGTEYSSSALKSFRVLMRSIGVALFSLIAGPTPAGLLFARRRSAFGFASGCWADAAATDKTTEQTAIERRIRFMVVSTGNELIVTHTSTGRL